MPATGEPVPEQEYLAELGHQIAELQGEAKRLNRRLRNARGTIQSIEDELAALAGQIQGRLAGLPEPDSASRGR